MRFVSHPLRFIFSYSFFQNTILSNHDSIRLYFEQISAELGLNEMRERTWQILPCSARTGDGLQEGMEWLVEQINSGKEEGKN